MQDFKPLQSLKKKEEFSRVYQRGKSFGSKLLVLYILNSEKGQEAGRLGISVSKKVGGSVERHRLRRLVKECFRLSKSEWAAADYVVVARREAAGKSYSEIENCLLFLNQKAKLWQKGENA